MKSFLLSVLAFAINIRGALGQPLSVTIIHINDHHSHLDEERFELRDDKVPPGLESNSTRLRIYMGKNFTNLIFD